MLEDGEYQYYSHHGQDRGDSHRLAQHGEFGDKLEDLFRDFFIPGIDDDSVIHKLLLESNPDLYKVIETAPE